MKRFITLLFCIVVSFDIIDNKYLDKKYTNSIKDYFYNRNYNLVINNDTLKSNKYKYNQFSETVKETTNFYPSNKNELLDIYYTFLNNGLDDFTYYCNKNYTDCFKDLKEVSEDANIFSYVNQLVHPYYSFKEINSRYNKLTRRVDINIEKKYTDEEIKKIDKRIDDIINELNINNYSKVEDKIRVFHDYIANINKYDKDKESKTSKYNSETAIGTLFEGYSVCSGYSDTLGIFLNKLGLENVKVITDKHAWNAVKINNNWYHIDLTWDDPIVTDGSDIISHDYFLLTTHELLLKNSVEHNYSRTDYSFLTK